MKRNLLILFMCNGLLAPKDSWYPDWWYGRTLHPNTSLFDVSKALIIKAEPLIIDSLRFDLNLLIPGIASFKTGVTNGSYFRFNMYQDRLTKSQLINRELHKVQDKIEAYQHLMAPQNLEQFKSIYKNFLSEYLMAKTCLDLVLLVRPLPCPEPFPEYDPTENNMVLSDMHSLICNMRSALNQDDTSCKFIQILNDSGIDKTTFSQHLSAIEDALAQISPDYNPGNFERAVADLESLKASFKK